MGKTILIFWILFCSVNAICQTDRIFHISEGVITTSLQKEIDSLKNLNAIFYEDNQYLVTRTCSGEWGGTVKFENKKTGKVYACSATCAVSVHKIDRKYYVTSTLAHGSGSCEVIEITDPEEMEIYKATKPRKVKGKKVKYVGDDESKSNYGTKKLIDSYGKMILGSFVFEGHFFHIVKERKRDFKHQLSIAKIENGEFKIAQIITHEDVFTYDRNVLKFNNGRIMIPIKGGYLDIYGNEIKILKYN